MFATRNLHLCEARLERISPCGQIMPGKKLLQTCMKVVRVGLLMHAQASVAHCDILPNFYERNFKVTVQS